MAFFSKDYSSPADQAWRTGESPYSGTLGPNRTADPIRDPWVADMKKNPDYANFYSDRTFANVVPQSQAKIDRLAQTDLPNFSNPGDQSFATDFARNYAQAISRGLVEKEKAVQPVNLANLMSEPATAGSNEASSNTAGKFPNQGVKVG